MMAKTPLVFLNYYKKTWELTNLTSRLPPNAASPAKIKVLRTNRDPEQDSPGNTQAARARTEPRNLVVTIARYSIVAKTSQVQDSRRPGTRHMAKPSRVEKRSTRPTSTCSTKSKL